MASRSASALAPATISCASLSASLALALIVGQQLRGLVLELARLVELGLDAAGALVERFADHAVDADIAEPGQEQQKGQRDPGFRFVKTWRGPTSSARRRPPSATALSLGAEPISRSMMARGGVLGDGADIGHGRLLGGGDGFLRLRQLDVELAFERLAGGFRRGLLFLARLVGDGLGAGAGIGQRLFIGRDRLVGLRLEPLGLGEVVGDTLLPALDDRGRRAAAPISPSARRAGRKRSPARRAARRRSATLNGGKPPSCSPFGTCSVLVVCAGSAIVAPARAPA